MRVQRDVFGRDPCECCFCERPIEVDPNDPERWPHWIYRGSFLRRGEEVIEYGSACRVCGDMDLMLLEAREDGRRYVEIARERCSCGRCLAVRERAPWILCVACHRDRRMLEPARRKIDFALRAARQLRRAALDIERERRRAA